MRRLPAALLALTALATAGLLAAIWAQAAFANGPEEWEWAYRSPSLAWPPAAVGALLLLGLAWLWERRGGRLPLLLLIPLIAAGWGFTLALVGAQPGGMERVLQSLVSRHSFSYVFDAGVVPDTRELLADYPRAIAPLDLHSRTHPPGPLLAVRAVDALTRRLPPPPEGTAGWAGTARDAFDREIRRARDRHRPFPSRPAGPWAVVALALLLPALSALAAWPLHGLALRWGLPPAVARLAVLLWLAVPARSLFTPSLDQALPLLLVSAAALAAGGRLVRAAGAGLLLFPACFLSYGCLAVVPLVGLIALGGGDETLPPRSPSRWLRPLVVAAAFLLPWLALALFAGYDPWSAFRDSVAAHRAMAVESRHYLTWLLWNPYDFALLLGPPVLGLALAGLVGNGLRSLSLRLGFLGWWGILVLLWVSGSVRGEVGRIWLIFMPFACLFAAAALVSGEEEEKKRWRWLVWVPVVLELALGLTLAANMVFVS